ncbi:hypothetical protein HanRHA438_Chr14g0671131 [Helianthus annuus]|nr:hypothetical protein HanRHA438_Chr14g0671131 [Helianthus annuus]
MCIAQRIDGFAGCLLYVQLVNCRLAKISGLDYMGSSSLYYDDDNNIYVGGMFGVGLVRVVSLMGCLLDCG